MKSTSLCGSPSSSGIVSKGGGSRSSEPSSDSCEYDEHRLPDVSFSETAQLYSRVRGTYQMGTVAGESPKFAFGCTVLPHSWNRIPNFWMDGKEGVAFAGNCVKGHT